MFDKRRSILQTIPQTVVGVLRPAGGADFHSSILAGILICRVVSIALTLKFEQQQEFFFVNSVYDLRVLCAKCLLTQSANTKATKKIKLTHYLNFTSHIPKPILLHRKMIDLDAIVSLSDQYAKHNWTLRRVLMKKASFGNLSEAVKTEFPDANVSSHEIDALWFSRKNKDSETWELRRIGTPPFALVEVINDDVPTEERENRLALLEHEMADQTQRPTNFGSENPNGNL